MRDKIKRVKVVVMDVDGVLTDGKIMYDSNGKEMKAFDVQDGFGVVLLRRAGIKTAIITAKKSKAVSARASILKVDKLFQNAYPKINAYKKMLAHFRVKDEEICYIGDDLFDLPLLTRVGFAVAVKNAVLEVKRAADYVTQNEGGNGAAREVIDLILKEQGKWKGLLDRVLKETTIKKGML